MTTHIMLGTYAKDLTTLVQLQTGPIVHTDHAGDTFQACGFTSSIGAKHEGHRALFDFEIEIVNGKNSRSLNLERPVPWAFAIECLREAGAAQSDITASFDASVMSCDTPELLLHEICRDPIDDDLENEKDNIKIPIHCLDPSWVVIESVRVSTRGFVHGRERKSVEIVFSCSHIRDQCRPRNWRKYSCQSHDLGLRWVVGECFCKNDEGQSKYEN